MRLPKWESAAVLFVSLFVLLPDCTAQGDDDCGRWTTCGDCMGSAECVWCLDDAQDVSVAPRCFGRDSVGAKECKEVEDAESAVSLVPGWRGYLALWYVWTHAITCVCVSVYT